MSTRLGKCVGITNSRLNAAKRGIAVEISVRLALATETAVCLVGADPTDRDVERHLPGLISAFGEPQRMEVTRGPHHLEVSNFVRSHMCVVSVSDREGVEQVLPALQERFRYIIIDAPSRAGSGVGIADVLLDWLDALVIATGLDAGELAETRQYTERIETLPSAQHVDVRVLTIGQSMERLAPEQLEARLALLPTISHVPRLGARPGGVGDGDTKHLDDAFQPLVDWIVTGRAGRLRHTPAEPPPRERHVANRLYRENLDR